MENYVFLSDVFDHGIIILHAREKQNSTWTWIQSEREKCAFAAVLDEQRRARV